MRRTVTIICLTVVWLLSGAPVAASAAPRLDQPGLERLRDIVAAAAPVGSIAHVEPDTGTVVLRMPGTRTARVIGAVGRHASQVRVVEQSASAITMTAVYGGIHMETAFGERSCSTGFLASGGGWLWMVTAGHCVEGGAGNTAYWYTQGGYNAGGLIGVGTILDAIPGRDFGAIQVSRISPHVYGPYVYMNGSELRITRAQMPSRGKGPYLGTAVCKAGQITNTTCGNVINTNVTVNFHTGTVTGLIETNACAQPGDSGAPLFSANAVPVFDSNGNLVFHRDGYGVLAGGNLYPCGHASFRSFYSPLVDALSAYGLTLVT